MSIRSITPSLKKITLTDTIRLESIKNRIKSVKAATPKLNSIGTCLTRQTFKVMNFYNVRSQPKTTQENRSLNNISFLKKPNNILSDYPTSKIDYKDELLIKSPQKTSVFVSLQSEVINNTSKDKYVHTTQLQKYYEQNSLAIQQEFETLINHYAHSSNLHDQYTISYINNWSSNNISITLIDDQYRFEKLPSTVEEFTHLFCQLVKDHGTHGSLGKITKKALEKHTILGQLLNINTGAKLGILSRFIPVTLKVTLKNQLSASTTNIQDAIKNKEVLTIENEKLLPSLLKKLAAYTDVYTSYADSLPSADAQGRSFQQSLVMAVNMMDYIDKNNELQRNAECQGKGSLFNKLSPNITLPKSYLFDSEKTYSATDLDHIHASNRLIQSKIKESELHLKHLDDSIGFHIEKLPTQAEVSNTRVLGVNPAKIDIDKILTKLHNLDTLLVSQKPNWRSRLIKFFYPECFQNEYDNLKIEHMGFFRLKTLKQNISTHAVDMKLEGFSDKPWFKYLLAKQIESLETESRGYKFGLFSIDSPYKKQLDILLCSNDWPTQKIKTQYNEMHN